MAKVGILYICTGKYHIFWKQFFDSAEKFFLAGHEVSYFVFTDAENIHMEECSRIHKFHQKPLPWPLTTLRRFEIFQSARTEIEKMDFLYFFNANMVFVDFVDDEFLPTEEKPVAALRHPLQYYREPDKYTYDRNPKSLAYIPFGEGEFYFMGALNGGYKSAYLKMVDELQQRVADDEKRRVIALWHDESHLNRYALEHKEEILHLDPSYGYPEGHDLPFDPKIVILDKALRGGHDYLRGISKIAPWYKRLFKAIKLGI